MYYVARVEFEGISDLLYGRKVQSEKRDDETHDAFERRTWMEKAHVRDDNLILPSMALKFGLESAGSWLRIKIPGKGNSEFKKRFAAGTMCLKNIEVFTNGKRATTKDLEALTLYVPADGKRGGTKRVNRTFPCLRAPWTVTGEVEVFDGMITQDILEKHLIAFGRFNGFGSMRVGNGGVNGICRLVEYTIDEMMDAQLAALDIVESK